MSYGQATPYFPVRDLLRRYCHLEDRDDAPTMQAKVTEQVRTLEAALQDTVPALLALLDALPADSPFWQLDPTLRRQHTLTALKRVLLRQSQEQPLLLVCEDLHWLDTETQALLDSLIESLPTARLLLLVNYRRTTGMAGAARPTTRKCGWTHCPQRVLTPSCSPLGDDPSLASLTSLLIQRTEGIPSSWRRACGRWWRPGFGGQARGLPHDAGSPDHADTGHRAGRPGGAHRPRAPEDKRLLQTAAVIGTEVPLPLLHYIAELSEDVLYRGLAHLQGAEFLYETQLFPEQVYTFKHALTHEVAYGSLLHERRRVLHARIVRPSRPSRPTGWPSRSNAWRTMPCGARCGTRP